MLPYPEEVKRKVNQELNQKYGKDLLYLQKCIELKAKLLEEKNEILKELNIANSESSVKMIIQSTEEDLEKTQEIVAQSKDLDSLIQADLKEVYEVRKKFKQYFEQLNILQCTHQYMRVIQYIDYLSEELQGEVGKKDDEQCVTLFANLTEISRNLEDFSGVHLGNYLKEIIHHWHHIIMEKLAKDSEIKTTYIWDSILKYLLVQVKHDKSVT